MKVTICTPSPDYRGPVRVWGSVHPKVYAWLPKHMLDLEPGDVAVLGPYGQRVERRFLIREGCCGDAAHPPPPHPWAAG